MAAEVVAPATVRLAPSRPAPVRIAYLDGWRAIAVGLVVYRHGAETFFGRIVNVGMVGVDIFFLISGFIITSLTLREMKATGSFSQSRFIARRCFRILPPLVLYLGAMVALAAARPIEAAYGLAFSCNTTLVICPWVVDHTWSLSFEEQFYLLFPFIVLRQLNWLTVLALAIYFLPLAFPRFWIGRSGFFEIAALFALGAAMAIFGERIRSVLARIPALLMMLCAAIVFAWSLWASAGVWHGALAPLVPFLLFVPVFGLPLRVGWFNTLLSSPLPRTIGLYSYSIYLWQQFFLRPGTGIGARDMAVAIVLTVGLSAVSFHTYELIFRRISRRFSPAITQGSL